MCGGFSLKGFGRYCIARAWYMGYMGWGTLKPNLTPDTRGRKGARWTLRYVTLRCEGLLLRKLWGWAGALRKLRGLCCGGDAARGTGRDGNGTGRLFPRHAVYCHPMPCRVRVRVISNVRQGRCAAVLVLPSLSKAHAHAHGSAGWGSVLKYLK